MSDEDSAQMLQALDAFDCTSPGRREISPLEAQINLLEFQCMPLPLLLTIRGLRGRGDSTQYSRWLYAGKPTGRTALERNSKADIVDVTMIGKSGCVGNHRTHSAEYSLANATCRKDQQAIGRSGDILSADLAERCWTQAFAIFAAIVAIPCWRHFASRAIRVIVKVIVEPSQL